MKVYKLRTLINLPNLINNVDIKQKAVKEFSLLTAPI